MQYEITLPADYDMEIIRTRVATRGHLTDDFEGLRFKAYLIQERANGAPANKYTPFYVWNDVDGMCRFLWGGGGFQNIVRDFGRPVVRHWTGVTVVDGPASIARSATLVTTPVPADADLAGFVEDAIGHLKTHAADENICSTALAIDPHHWELIHFTLWSSTHDLMPGSYQVLHISQPS